MTIKYNYLFIYNQPSVWQTWKYFSKQQLPWPMMPLHCFMLLLTSSSKQHPNMWAVLSQFIWSFHVHFCKIFSQLQIFSSWEKRSQRAVLGPGLWTVFMLVLAELGPAEAVHQRPGKPSVWAEPALFAESSCVTTPATRVTALKPANVVFATSARDIATFAW